MSDASRRVTAALRHLLPDHDAAKSQLTARQRDIKWNGWGFVDSKFAVNSRGQVELTGNRYSLSGQEMPSLREWMESQCGVSLDDESPSQKLDDYPFPDPIVNEDFVRAVNSQCSAMSFNGPDRLLHGHGHTAYEIYQVRHAALPRIPDVVLWPTSNEQVQAVVAAAAAHNVCVIPFGGGTTVSHAVLCPENEHRMIVSLDMTAMNRVLWVDEENMVCRVQAGIIGSELERQLTARGVCVGHEPDSLEFSSLGGWISTRASGMKKNTYGNIEDILVRCRMETVKGTLELQCQAPRISCGPDINHMVLGSEGTLGVITEATLRIRELPVCQRYGSVIFRSFEQGVAFMREVRRLHAAPVSIRLVDNTQFQFGQALKPAAASYFQAFADKLKKLYVLKWQGFDPDQMVVCTLVFEGTTEAVDAQEKALYAIAARHDGLKAGEENGKRGYFLTFTIAYLRDIGMDYYFIAESFETSVPWSKVVDLCRNTKDRIAKVCDELGVHNTMISCRVTQLYEVGAAVYFYFGFNYKGLADPPHTYELIETAARNEILANGGTISHHHGVGKLRKQYVARTITPIGVDMLRAVKNNVDPNNIFGSQNLV